MNRFAKATRRQVHTHGVHTIVQRWQPAERLDGKRRPIGAIELNAYKNFLTSGRWSNAERGGPVLWQGDHGFSTA
jgi:hypothetical protein